MKSVPLVFLFLFIINTVTSTDLDDDDEDCEADYSETVSQQQTHSRSQSRKSFDVPAPPPRTPSPRTALQCRETIPKSTEGPPPYDSCDSGWTAFRRLKGVRCLKAFPSNSVDYQSAAASLCAAQNAVLAGIENNDERDWIHEQFRPLVVNISDARSIWIGGSLKSQCAVMKNMLLSCLPAQTQMFSWTDTSVTGTDGFCPWWKDQPDNGKDLIQNCIHFAILRGSQPVGPYEAIQGGLDDTTCYQPPPMLIGYVCSKAALNIIRDVV